MKLAALALAISFVLAGCSASGASSMHEATAHMGEGPMLLQQVRAAGELGRELDVQPLRDPQVEDLRATATAAEAKGDYAGAQRALARALEISPKDPDLLQWQAEMSLVAHDWSHAQAYAEQSWTLGPKLGGLCRRNWTTLQLAAEARSDAAAASRARQQSAACAVAPPTRY
jgi:tetratricopeptide (TPR) repeat protein